MLRRFAMIGLSILAVSAHGSAHGQTPGSDYIARDATLLGRVLRVSPAGQVITTLSITQPWYSFAMDETNRYLSGVMRTNPFQLVVWDYATNAAVRQIGAGSLIADFGLDQHGDFAWIAAGVLQRRDFGRLQRLAPMSNLIGRDLQTGDYVGLSRGSVVRVTRSGVVGSTLWSGFTAAHAVQDDIDGSWILIARRNAMTDLLRYSPTGGLTTIRSLRADVGFPGMFIDIPSTARPYVFHDNQSRIYRSDRAGNVTTVTTPIPDLDGIIGYRARHLASVRRGTVAAPNLWDLPVSFPSEPGQPFAVALSITGFTPGRVIGGVRYPLVFDQVALLSVTGQLAPFFVNNRGLLNPQGEQVATLDLRSFGPAVSGLRVWALAAAFDTRQQPARVRVSRPIVIVLD